jgi:hypothetical protein
LERQASKIETRVGAAHMIQPSFITQSQDALASLAREYAAWCRSPHSKAPRKPRKPSLAKLIAQAERSGRTVTSITMPDGTTIHFGEPSSTDDASNPWLVDLEKATKQ